jgi:hypothetical protein
MLQARSDSPHIPTLVLNRKITMGGVSILLRNPTLHTERYISSSLQYVWQGKTLLVSSQIATQILVLGTNCIAANVNLGVLKQDNNIFWDVRS